jgi:hypothetical protein
VKVGIGHILAELAGEKVIGRVLADQQGERVRQEAVRIQINAVRGTAQFVNRFRKQLHRTGAIDFDLPRGAEMPPWGAIAFEMLRLRKKKWHVVTMRGPKGGKRVRVYWKGWSGYREHAPANDTRSA